MALTAAKLKGLRKAIEAALEVRDAFDSLEFQILLNQHLNGDIDFYETVRNFEIFLIKQALKRSQGKQIEAASLLGLNASTLCMKMKAYDLRPTRPHLIRNSNVG
jgi:DNA-binding protein Fis